MKNQNHYAVEGIETELTKLESDIAAATVDTDRCFEGFRRSFYERHRTEAELKDALDHAKERAAYVIGKIRESKTTRTCSDCKLEFAFYEALFEVNAHGVFRNSADHTRCEDCDTAVKHREWRRKALAKFYDSNELAGHYCGMQGNPPRPQQYEATVECDLDEVRVLLLVGNSFTGKSVAAYHLLKRLVDEDWHSALAVNSSSLNDIPDRVRNGTIEEWREEMMEPDVLLLDDLDKVRITPRVASELWTLFERRLRGPGASSRWTVVTLNIKTKRDFVRLFSVKEAESRQVGLSIYNRLTQSCVVIDFDVDK